MSEPTRERPVLTLHPREGGAPFDVPVVLLRLPCRSHCWHYEGRGRRCCHCREPEGESAPAMETT